MRVVTEFHPIKSGPMIAFHDGSHMPVTLNQNMNIAGVEYIIKFIDWSIDGSHLPIPERRFRQNIYLERCK